MAVAMPPQPDAVIARFWARVDKTGDCWLWTGCKNDAGYGAIRWQGRTTRAHRISWVLTNGDIPDGRLVLHRCDNRPCVRPDHLFVGSHADNSRDMVAKDRRGHVHGRILDAEQVAEIRRRRAEGEAAKDLALAYGVTVWTVFDILSQRIWKVKA